MTSANATQGPCCTEHVDSDDQLLAAFERGTLRQCDWRHETHVRVAYLYVSRCGLMAAVDRMRDGIRALNEAHGTPNTDHRGYHETVTCAFVHLIAVAVAETPGRLDSKAFCQTHPHLVDKQVLANHYSKELLASPRARRVFLEPDLAALPKLAISSATGGVARRDDPSESPVVEGVFLWKLLFAFALIYVVWGSTYLAIRFAIETLPPFMMAGVRFLGSGFGLYVLARLTTRERTTWRQWRNAILIGTMLFVGGIGMVCWAEQTVPSGIAALIVATVPLWMVVLDTLCFGKSRPGPVTWVGLAVGLLGVIILINPFAAADERINPLAALALLGSCCSWSCGSLFGRTADQPRSLLLAVAMQMLGGGLALGLLSLLVGEAWHLELGAISAKSLWSLAYLIVMGGMVAFSAYAWLLRVCDAGAVSTYAYVNPVIAVFLGSWLGNEPFTSATFSGAILIIFSVVLIVRRRKRGGLR